MKKFLFSALVLVASTAAFADNYNMGLNDTRNLGECGGSISIRKSANPQTGNEQLNIIFRDVVNCSRFDILRENGATVSDYREKTLGGTDRSRDGSFTLPSDFMEIGYHSVKIIITSISGKTSDTINVSYRVVPSTGDLLTNGEEASLNSCGGTIRVSITNGQANIVLNDVQNCSNFSIRSFGYKQEIPGPNGRRSGSFTVPSRFIKSGYNVLNIEIASDSGIHKDVKAIGFYAY